MTNPAAPPSDAAASPSNRIKEFRSLVKRAVLLDRSEMSLFDTIPDVLFERILVKNFNDNMALAERVLLNKYSDIDTFDRPLLEQKKRNIRSLDKASKEIRTAISAGKKVLFLTDNDNDGSMAQAVFLEFFNALPEHLRPNVHRAYAQPIGSARGLNKENVDVLVDFLGWGGDEDVVLVTADIGINNRVEQERILDAYPHFNLVVTDHHLPVPEHVVQENKRTIIFNPQYQPTDFFKKKNISGADTLAVLLKEVLTTWVQEEPDVVAPQVLARVVGNINEIATWSNLLDYVEADVVDMPLRPSTIKKALDLRALLNVSNSMGPLVTLEWGAKDWDKLKTDIPNIDVEFIKSRVAEIKGLNRYAQKLLALASDIGDDAGIAQKDFYALLSETLENEDSVYDSPNPNYIAQLRPHIFRFSAIDSPSPLTDTLKDQMVLLYDDLQAIEKEIIKTLQTTEMLSRVKADNATIVYPKSAHVTRIFSRKLLNKIYNEENNGFFLTLDKNAAEEYSGSMRALYPMNEILPDEQELENELGVDIEILGHAKAAGFKIHPRPGTVLDRTVLKKLNTAISERVEVLKQAEKAQTLPFLSIDFASVGLVQKINTAVKAHLSNMNGLPTVLRLGQQGSSSVFVTDPKSTQQVDLAHVVKQRKYGYQAIQTDFHGNAFVVPVEQLRSLVQDKFRPLLKMSYMDDGVFIANQVVEAKSLKNMVEFKGDRKEQEALIGYYETEYRDGNFIPLGREDFQNLPYFRYNAYGKSEFEHFEQLVIDLLEETGQDVLAVIDTEGTGLGQAPKCFNIGGTNIKIKDGSGSVLEESEFDQRFYRDAAGHAYLLDEQSLGQLQPATSADQQGWHVFKSNATGGTTHEQEYVLPELPKNALRLTNYTRKAGEVLFNRTIDGFAFSFIVKDKDFAITKEFENLTGISQTMVERQGSPTVQVDEILSEYYSTLKNADGSASKIIFSAHNLPYDKGVVSSNFNKFNTVMDDHVLCDTAKLSRHAKLAYDDTPVATFENVEAIPAASKVYFYDSPFSSYSLSTFLDRAARGKGGVYPDTSGRYLLHFNAITQELSFIDKKELDEVRVDETVDSLLEKKRISTLPNNAVKFSVERLSMRAMIRNIILHDYEKPHKVDLSAQEQQFENALVFFQDQYHFDNTLDENIRFFRISRHNANDVLTEDMLLHVGQRFLELNKDIQARFHDGWIYEKVLSLYEPAVNEGKIPQDAINQVNYHTNLPRKKIEKVLADTIKFKKKFGVSHALVHEQHNNIRQRSVDGQGLSDTAYESVLPNLLAMMKYYNPYTESSQEAIAAIIDVNLRGAMTQLMVKKEHQDLAAVDSFSMRQMQAFDRAEKTTLVGHAQKWFQSGGWDGANTPIRFKLEHGTLPPGSGVYGVPLVALTEEEIDECSRKLNVILLNEQLRTSASLSRSISVEHGERLREIASHNDLLCIQFRDELMEKFASVEFHRKEATIKKLSEMMKDAFDGKEPHFTDTLVKEIRKNPDLLLTAAALQITHHNIERRLGKPAFLTPTTAEKVSNFLEALTDLVQSVDDVSAVGNKIKRAAVAKSSKKLAPFYEGSLVRSATFLPDLDIRRDEPLKFILKNAGPRFLSRYLSAQTEDPVVPQAAPKKGPR